MQTVYICDYIRAGEHPRVGAIASGRPPRKSGARFTGTLARALARSEGKTALVSMCIGVGQGMAMSLEVA